MGDGSHERDVHPDKGTHGLGDGIVLIDRSEEEERLLVVLKRAVGRQREERVERGLAKGGSHKRWEWGEGVLGPRRKDAGDCDLCRQLAARFPVELHLFAHILPVFFGGVCRSTVWARLKGVP